MLSLASSLLSSSSSSAAPAASSSESAAPVGSDIAKIVAYYNNAANATKAYKGTIKITCKDGTNTKITETSFPKAAVSIANDLLPNDYPKTETCTCTNGQVKGTKVKKDGKKSDINKSMNDYIVIYGDSKMSKLTAAGVASATCAKTNGGYKVTLKLKPEQVTGLSQRPASHFACMQVMDITEDDLKPFTLEQCTVKYLGGTITAVVNDKGLLTSYSAVDPMEMSGSLKWTAIKGTATLSATYQGAYTFAY